MNEKKNDITWKLMRVDEIGDVISGGTPSTTNPDFWDGKIPFITPLDLNKNGGAYISNVQRYITEKGLENSSANLLPPNSLAISSRAPIGYLSLCETTFVTNQGCKSVNFNKNQSPIFHYYNFQLYVNEMKKYGVGTTFSEISKGDLCRLQVNVPEDIIIQENIAQILTTCDKVIQQTEAVIAKYKAIKQGMLHDLFTRGLDGNGKLRPTPTEAPELYKESELGLIPKDWDVKRLNEIANINPATLIYLEKSDIVTFLKMEDVSNDAQILHNEGRALELNKGKGFTMFQENDILFAKITPCMENGKGALAKGLINEIGFGSTEFHVLRAIDKKSINYIYYLTTSKSFRLKAQAQMTGSAGQQRVSKDFLERYLLKCPAEDEQLQIGLLLVSAEKNIICEDKVLEKYKAVKIGLMKKLLTK